MSQLIHCGRYWQVIIWQTVPASKAHARLVAMRAAAKRWYRKVADVYLWLDPNNLASYHMLSGNSNYACHK